MYVFTFLKVPEMELAQKLWQFWCLDVPFLPLLPPVFFFPSCCYLLPSSLPHPLSFPKAPGFTLHNPRSATPAEKERYPLPVKVLLASGTESWGFPGVTSGKEPACLCRRRERHGFNPWVEKIPQRRTWKPTPVFLSGESHGQRSLAGYSWQGSKELVLSEAT